MVPIATCPPADRLNRLICGELSEAEVESLVEHIKDCPHCVPAIQMLNDSIVRSDLRAAARLTDSGDSPIVQELIHKLIQSRDHLETASSLSSLSEPTLSNEGTPANSEDLDFLSPPQAPGELGRLNGYRILRILGSGGMGLVLEGEDIRLKRRVALKVMKQAVARKEQNRQRFVFEAEAAARVEHDHIVPIFQVGEENGVPFIAMPFLKGEPLDARLKRGRMETPEIIHIGRQIAEGLAAAHAHGLIHRDIKPGNIWLEDAGSRHQQYQSYRVRILDFGLARLSGDSTNLTQSGTIIGTPAYMAPEQARGRRDLDSRVDLWSLGCILYEMSTGQRPFPGSDTLAIFSALALDTPADPESLNPGIPGDLSQLIMKLLEKDPAKRIGSADEVAATLRSMQPEGTTVVVVNTLVSAEASVFAGLVDSAAAVKPTPRARKLEAKTQPRSPVKKWIVAASLLLLLMGGGLAAYQIIFQTKDGTLVVEVDDDADIRFAKGELKIFDSAGKLAYTLKPSEKNKLLPPGSYRVEVVGADGLKIDTEKFEIVRDGKATVRVYSAPPMQVAKTQKVDVPSPPITDQERQAALKLYPYATLRVSSGTFDRWIYPGDPLPAEPFKVRAIRCKKNLPLDILKEIGQFKNLEWINADSPNDEFLASLGDLPKLAWLELGESTVTDKGIQHIQKYTALKEVAIKSAALTDASCDTFAKLKNLQYFDVNNDIESGLTEKGLNSLHEALPRCRIIGWKYDIQPTPPLSAAEALELDPNQKIDFERKGAEALLPYGGLRLKLIGSDKEIYIPPEGSLPTESFDVRDIYLLEIPRGYVETTLFPILREFKHVKCIGGPLTEDQCEQLATLPCAMELEKLDFRESFNLTPKSLKTLTRLPKLQLVRCVFSEWGDEVALGLKELRALVALEIVFYPASKITVKGISAISKLPLTYLKLRGVRPEQERDWGRAIGRMANLESLDVLSPGDEFFAEFGKCPKLVELKMLVQKLTDAGLQNLSQLTSLKTLIFVHGRGALTEEGIQKLHEQLPKCKIELGYDNVFEPLEVQRKAAEDLHPYVKLRIKLLSDGNSRDINPGDALPNELFEVWVIEFVKEGKPIPPSFAANILLPAMRKMRNIREFHTFEGTFSPTEAELLDILSLPHLSKLESLKIPYFSSAKVDEALAKLPKLSKLVLWPESAATQEGVQKLSSALPNCCIESKHGNWKGGVKQ